MLSKQVEIESYRDKNWTQVCHLGKHSLLSVKHDIDISLSFRFNIEHVESYWGSEHGSAWLELKWIDKCIIGHVGNIKNRLLCVHILR